MESKRNDIPQEFSEALKVRVGKNLRRKRQEEGLSLRAFSRKVGAHDDIQSIWRWENGVNLPRLDMIVWICVKMGWKLSEILGGSVRGAEGR